MNPGKRTDRWNQIMTLPRRLTVNGDTVYQEPAGDMESLRGKHVHVGGTTLKANRETILDDVSGNAFEIVAEIDPKDATSVDLNVLRSPGSEEFTRITFYKERGYRDRNVRPHPITSAITLDSTYASTASDVKSRAPETTHFTLPEGDNLKLRIFVDRSVVEVFVNGVQCIALRVYPDRPDSTGVSLRAQGSEAQLVSLDAWQMENIYT